MSDKFKRSFRQYSDWIAGMFPDLAWHDPTRDDNKVLAAKEFTFQVTDACNLACTYCYQTNKGKRKMPIETAKLAVDKLLSGEDGFAEYLGVENSPAIALSFIGGEPFLEIDLIDEIVDYFRMRAIELNHPWAERFCISICSNGVLYRDPRVQRFLQKNCRNMSFSVTVDGTKELHDACRVFPDGSPSYDLAHDAAMDWMSRGYYMGSKITIAPENIKYLSDCLKKMVLDGYVDINANCVYEDVWRDEHPAELYKQCKEFADWFLPKYDPYDYTLSLLTDSFGTPLAEDYLDNWCGGTGVMLAMDPDGKLYPCLRYMESSLGDRREPLVIGDVWNGIAQRKCEQDCIACMKAVDRRTESTDECFYCPVASGCSWCSAYNYEITGTVDKRVTFICKMHRARSLAAVYFWNTYYKTHGLDMVKNLWCPKEWALEFLDENEYEMLVELTESLGGYVNRDKVAIKGYKADDYPAETTTQ